MKFGAGHWGTGQEVWFSGGVCPQPAPDTHLCPYLILAKHPQPPSGTHPAHCTQALAEHMFPYW